MKAADKKKCEALVKAIQKVHGQICDLTHSGVLEEYSVDICALDAVVQEIENQMEK